jgi:hypothetical protein
MRRVDRGDAGAPRELLDGHDAQLRDAGGEHLAQQVRGSDGAVEELGALAHELRAGPSMLDSSSADALVDS